MATNWEDLVSDDSLEAVYKLRKKSVDTEKVNKGNIATMEGAGWVKVKEYKRGDALMERPKKVGDAFEDEVWTILYKMGFKVMNASRKFTVSYSKDNPSLTKQIDVIAIDDEVCLLVECKAAEKMTKGATWKKELESIDGFKGKVFKELQKQYPDRKYKYIFATKNHVIGDSDKDRLKDFKIANFDYETVQYYEQLVEHLGSAAKYQLLANLFVNEEIKGIENRVPAIKGKMGGMEYYSFSIEPDKLLKIAYVLHRNNANYLNMPTYQRIIKKDRLKAVREFINNKGYFPNSLIISIDTKKGQKLQFDKASLQVEDSLSKIGILHLPKTYQSAYVIDGQHRLYGYSDSDYASKSSIPVVAFVDLDKKEQLKMFMDINENQKAVHKSLKNTLKIDMLWESPNYSERNTAIMLNIALRMGEDSKSPLYGRVVTGENITTTDRCITLEYIKDALAKSSFFNVYKKNNSIDRYGTLAKNDNKGTIDNILPMIYKYFDIIEKNCKEQWDQGKDGYLTMNNSMYAMIKILDDMVNIALKKQGKTSSAKWEDVFTDCTVHINSLCETIKNLSDIDKQAVKNARGGNAKTDTYRIWQVALYNTDNTFINDDLKEYMEEYCIDYTSEVLGQLGLAENGFKYLLKTAFMGKDKWMTELLPESLTLDLIQRIAKEAFLEGIPTDKYNVWKLISFSDIIKIIDFQSNWSIYLQKHFNNDESGIRKTKQNIKNDLNTLIKLDNKSKNGTRFTKTDLNNLKEINKIFQ